MDIYNVDQPGVWIDVDIPLEQNTDNTKGFSLQSGDGDKILQLEHIKGFEFGLNYETAGGDTNITSTGSLLLDKLTLEEKRSIPIIFFNGKSLANSLDSGWTWGESTLEFVQGMGRVPELNALKWVQGNGWSGFGFTISPPFDMSWSYDIDSLKFWMKAEPGVKKIRVQLESGANGKVGKVFTPIDDNQWHQYIIALMDLVPQDATTTYDSSNVGTLRFMAENSGIAGKVIYLSEIWTGNPVCDCIFPNSVTDFTVVTEAYKNLICWADVAGETNEVYDIYFSDKPITDITNAGVVKLGIPENTQLFEHRLRTPLTDQNLSYYYAIVCKSDVGNPSVPTFLNTPTINMGKGVPTIAKTAPVNFKADGDLTEWVNVPQIKINLKDGTGYDVSGGSHNGDADYSLIAYLAVDNDNLYFAADVTDDFYSWKRRVDPWMNDCINLMIGLFDAHDKTAFTSYKHGTIPHYQLCFDQERVTLTNSDSLLYAGTNYFFGTKTSPGYIYEAKIPLVDLAKKRNYNYLDQVDSIFHPAEGMQIPIDFSCNDADVTGNRELIFCYSPFNEDMSWRDPSRWLWTWIGEKMTVGVNDEAFSNRINSYNLVQNYPNPFNPTTTISYQLLKDGLVTIKVYDILGNEVKTLVNEQKEKGKHTTQFDAGSLASGMYLYQIRANDFVETKKMLLIK